MRTIALVACSTTKLSTPAPARDLYQGHLFRLSRAWAERFASSWYILSAKYAVLDPDRVIEPYDFSMADLARGDRYHPLTPSPLARPSLEQVRHPAPVDAWAIRCRGLLMGHRGQGARILAGDRVVILAGAAYREPLVSLLVAWHALVETPLAQLGIGRQKQWLRRQLDRSAAAG